MEEDCVSCGKCSSVCPISSCNKETDNVFRRFYGQIKNNKILMESSSGGAWRMCCHDAADREWFIRHDDL